jgi:exopolysaccharide biosynthesis polyprenyl glycosylphosphotransferase
VLVLTFLFHFAGILAWRLLLRVARAGHPQRVLVAAADDEALRIVEKLLHEPPGWYEVVGVSQPSELSARGAAALTGVDVLIAGPSVTGSERQSVVRLALAANARVYLLPALDDILLFGAVAHQIDDAPVLEVKPLALSTAQRMAKRVFDLVLAVPLLIVTAPIMAGTWLVIKLFSPGPALFTQTRVGRNGKEFTLCKFRTMVVDAEKHTGPVLAVANDSRITPLGEFLRATRLDELPQLWNVLRGDMSLVGPRPERPYFVNKFSQEMPDYGLRHLVPPGVTGLAQVMGTYHTSVQNKLRFDLYYVRHYSVWLDFKILLLTLQAVISKESAAGVSAAGTSAAVKAQELVLSRSFRV